MSADRSGPALNADSSREPSSASPHRTTITESYNLSAAANTNAENIVVIKHKATAEAYARNFQAHKEHSARVLP